MWENAFVALKNVKKNEDTMKRELTFSYRLKDNASLLFWQQVYWRWSVCWFNSYGWVQWVHSVEDFTDRFKQVTPEYSFDSKYILSLIFHTLLC